MDYSNMSERSNAPVRASPFPDVNTREREVPGASALG